MSVKNINKLLSIIIAPNGVERVSMVGFDININYVTCGHFALVHGKQPARNESGMLIWQDSDNNTKISMTKQSPTLPENPEKTINSSPRLIEKNIFIYGTVIVCRLVNGQPASIADTPANAMKLLDAWDVLYPIVHGMCKLRTIILDMSLAGQMLSIKFAEKGDGKTLGWLNGSQHHGEAPEYFGVIYPIFHEPNNPPNTENGTIITIRSKKNISLKCEFGYINKRKYIYNITFVPEYYPSIQVAIEKVFAKAKKWLTITRRNVGSKSEWIITYQNVVDMFNTPAMFSTFAKYSNMFTKQSLSACINVDTCEQYFDFNDLRIYSDGRGKFGDLITFNTPNFDGDFARLFEYMKFWRTHVKHINMSKLKSINVRFSCWRTDTKIAVEDSSFGSVHMNKTLTTLK